MPAFVREFLAGRPKLAAAATHESGHAVMCMMFGFPVRSTGVCPFLPPQLGETVYTSPADDSPDIAWRRVLVLAAGRAAMLLRGRSAGFADAHDGEDRDRAEAMLATLPSPAPGWDHTVGVACGILGDPKVWPVLLAVEDAITDGLALDGKQLERVIGAAGGLPAVPRATTRDGGDDAGGFDPLPAECVDVEDSLTSEARP